MAGDIILSIISIIYLIIAKTAIIWVPLCLGWLSFFLWHHFVAERFIGGIQWVVLEIHIPRDMQKTPLAMELFFTNALYHMSQKGTWELYWQGAIHFWYSLEIASIDGKVHFFVRAPSRLKKLVETQLYAQYPQVRIEEVEDYTLKIPRYRQNGNWYYWGCDFKLKEHDALPIRTYKDYGLDKQGLKEEDKIDPITPIIEHLGSIDRGEQVWIQYIVRQSAKNYHQHGTVFGHLKFYEESNRFLEEMLAPFKRAQKNDNNAETFAFDSRVPEYLKDTVKSIKEKQMKLPFDCGIRIATMADKRLISQSQFDTLRRSSRLMFRQFTDPDSNGFERFNSTQYDYPWSDPTGKLLENMKNRHLTYFKLRTMYYPPLLMSFEYPQLVKFIFPSLSPKYSVLNTEELATIFHFPGLVSETPSFTRIETKTSKPPSNLPF
jgi:hypothetical protein